ncbi:hypothetical protein [Bacillus cereus]|uniref:hypothetical protein n=1 Tax=Bacillus cereus TaxID=1396 RepID=UPI0009366189|nr:hypothetical protein [Bacillus cereus]OKA18081.1 hypothetical protein BJR05_27565 [Bacillus cereus]
MTNNWFKDMEKITICIGFAIVYLGINNIYGDAIISPALVTGISVSGLCLTIADLFSKQFKNVKNKIIVEMLSLIDFTLYIVAACFILGYPNSTVLNSLDKETLDSMSTTASVVALGFVFISIGISNRKAVVEEEKQRFKEIKEMLNESKNISGDFKELSEEMYEILIKKDEQIKELEKKITQLEENKTTASV